MAGSSLPGLTRQSILFARSILRTRIDPRVKPGGDAGSLARAESISPPHLMLWTAPPPARKCHGCGCC
jgi:hypothetical protein